QMGKRYIPNRRLPDIAIDLIDTACASAIITLNSEPKDISDLKRKAWSLELEKTSLEMDIGRAGTNEEQLQGLRQGLADVEERIEQTRTELRSLEDAYNAEKGHVKEARELKQKLEDAKNRVEQAQRENDRYLVYDLQTNIIPVYEKQLAEYNDKVEIIDVYHVMEIISRLSGIPISKISTKESEKLLTMEDKIKESIFGQDHAVKTVVDCILSSKVGLGNENRPIGSFLFLGPTGVGKTELSKAICRELNGTCDNMVVLDMSDYASEISLNKLIGAPAGYVGCEDGGTLTEPVKEMPYTVVLLDEVNLAHQSVLNVLYQLLDEGRVTDGRGVRVSFRDTVVIMTSNLGQEYIHETHHELDKIEEVVARRFGYPLINRIDNIVTFNHLTPDALNSILNREMAEVNKKLVEKRASFIISDAVREYAIGHAAGSGYGARIMRRFVRDNFVGVLTKIILSRNDAESYVIRTYMMSEGVEGTTHGMFTFTVTTN
ncbi:ATP-dependent Clp protease ATP-binding subunit ClpB, partial [Pancytospora epiphaga]